MNMKKLIESMDHIEECGMAEGPMGMAPPAPEMDKGNPVTVNVSMNASGKEHVADLLDMMKNAGLGDAEPAADAMMSPRMDMERLSGIMGEPADVLDDKAMSLPAPDDIEGSEDESYANEMDDGEITKDSVKKSALELLVDIAKTSKQYKGEITDDQVHYLGSLIHDFDVAGIETEKYSEIEKLFRSAADTERADMSMIQPAYAQAKNLDEEADLDEGMEADEVQAILAKHPESAAALKQGADIMDHDDLYDDLYAYFADSGDMPYGTQKARDGDPYEWVHDKLDSLGLLGEEATEDTSYSIKGKSEEANAELARIANVDEWDTDPEEHNQAAIESWHDEVVSAITDRNITFPIADNEIQKIADDVVDDWSNGNGPDEHTILSIIDNENDQVNQDQKDEATLEHEATLEAIRNISFR